MTIQSKIISEFNAITSIPDEAVFLLEYDGSYRKLSGAQLKAILATGGGGINWGSIGGDIENQTDLVSALHVLETEIDTNASNISTNALGISGNATAISTLDGQVVKKTGSQDIGGNKTFTGQTAASRKTIAVSASRNLALTDIGCRLKVDTSGADITLTIPPQSSVAWLADCEIEIYNDGANNVIIAGGTGVTQESNLSDDADHQVSQKRMSCILKRESSDVWSNQGNIELV